MGCFSSVGSTSSQPMPLRLGLPFSVTQACPDPRTLLGPTGPRSQLGQDAPTLLAFPLILRLDGVAVGMLCTGGCSGAQLALAW